MMDMQHVSQAKLRLYLRLHLSACFVHV